MRQPAGVSGAAGFCPHAAASARGGHGRVASRAPADRQLMHRHFGVGAPPAPPRRVPPRGRERRGGRAPAARWGFREVGGLR